MNIYDIKIYDITNQYIEYLESMKEMDLELTSEFIVMAATLLEIKSKMLLSLIHIWGTSVKLLPLLCFQV